MSSSKKKRARDEDATADTQVVRPLGGRVILVTGAGGGIGRAACKLLASRGAHLIAADLNLKLAEETVSTIAAEANGARVAIAVQVDVADEKSVAAMMKAAIDEFGRLDGALNAAGIEGERAPIHECTLENFERVINVNLRGTFLCMKAQLQQFLQQDEQDKPPPPSTKTSPSQSTLAPIDEKNYVIVNISSTAGQAGMPEFSSYSSSKFGLLGLTRTAAKEYASKGVRVLAVCPSTTATPMVERFTERWPDWQAKQNASFPVGRIGQPEEVAALCGFLFSRECTMMTGCSLTIDGALGA